MSAKTSPARIAAFLAALRATGNQTLAAERAKVSRAWVQLHRSTDLVFAAAVREAVAAARSALRADPSPQPLSRKGRGANQPPAAWASQGGEELVVRGRGEAEGGERVQIARARLKQWTPRGEARFLRALAATCNVRAACAAVGLTPASAYKHRERWPGFAERWEEALAQGVEALEAALLEAGHAALVGGVPGGGEAVEEAGAAMPAISGMDAQQALNLLVMHKYYVPRAGRLPGRPPGRVSEGELAATIFRLLDEADKWAARKEGRKAGRG